ncbi:hydroxyacid dehydrogenase [Streptomyces narbonensis]|uniref:hydroxyacid dehydrogenase n=1 Tax=Streptomyces narbonensis TaxID=67333 RepID=UPI001672C440|nr:hydroxyacid dehydrogenase [Streptomyces narbonensis]GGW09137.1 dehydrogenase [Streptomyces narbonensis]
MHPATDNRPALLLAMGPDTADRLLTDAHRRRLTALTRTDPHLVAHDLTTPDARTAAALAEAELLLTGWGATPLTTEVLDRAPRLKAVVHAAGSVKHHITDACWDRGLRVTTAAAANALPVAEYTLAAILFAGKQVLRSARRYAELRTDDAWLTESAAWGNHRRTIGIVGASRIGRRVIELLRPFDFEILLYDPYAEVPPPGVELTDLDDLCARSTVVSVHAPQLPSTYRMIGPAQLAAMPDGTTLINTARGSLIDETALLPHLLSGRLHATLDVTDPELPPVGSPLWTLPNVLLTPHVAGSLGNELHRMTDQALEEVRRYVHGEPFAEEVRASDLQHSA